MAGIAQRPPCRHVISGLRQKNTNTENSSKGKTRCLEAASPWSQGDCQPPLPTFQSPPKRVMELAAPMGAPGKKGGGRCARNVSAWPGRSGVTRDDLAHHLCEARFPPFTVLECPLLPRCSGMSPACAFCRGGLKSPRSEVKDAMCLRVHQGFIVQVQGRCLTAPRSSTGVSYRGVMKGPAPGPTEKAGIGDLVLHGSVLESRWTHLT